MKVEFKACEHLDYEPNYGKCKRQLISCDGTKLCWMRPGGGGIVQFCKKRGRLNSPTSCLDITHAVCNDFNEITHEVDVPEEEYE